MDQNKIRSLLEQYLRGTCSQEEREWMDRWFEADRNSEQPLADGKAQELEEAMLSRIQEHLPQRTNKRRLWFAASIAASIMLLIGVFILFSRPGQRHQETKQPTPKLFTFHTEPGQRAKLRLPDSSIIWLNGNTAIRYDQHFTGPNRAIYLDKGEAYFEIHPDQHQPFIVHTATLQTRVLGTSFNLQVQNHRNQYSLSINTGKVSVSHNQGKIQHTVLIAGQQFTYDYINGSHQIKAIQPGSEHAWIYNELVFQSASWKEVVAQLQTWYGVTIYLDLQRGRNETFTARFEDPTLEAVLKALQKINPFQYNIKKKEVHIHN
ncbi:FecR domain-containing protein [Olivibacter sp. CPCC 100613]|uniref:FecR family protein n=1 Tax=Olivibacter sp. CPCC 100613 TaxID=3079931 RepID=UPI002FF70916